MGRMTTESPSSITIRPASVILPRILALFTAQLFYDEAAGALAAGTAAALADVVLKGYLEACGQRETLLRYNLHTAAKLLQLTPQAFRTRHPQWPELMARLVYHAVAFWRNHARHETGT